MKIVIIGGHFSPALSVIEKLKDEDILYIGRKHALEGDSALSLEFETLNSLGVNFAQVNTGRLQRKPTFYTIPSLAKMPVGFWQSYRLLRRFKPSVVVGFGGYLSVPVVFAAYLLNIPVVLHEQTLEAGFANKILARFAKRICISWESSYNFFPGEKTVLTGNPLRKEILEEIKYSPVKNKNPLIYITGGSLGSHRINALIEKNIEKILSFASVIHQTGDARKFNDYERLLKLKNELGDSFKSNYQLFKFLKPHMFGKIIRESDLVIARSGINTVCEIIYLKRPALFVPLSFTQRNEQKKNALMAKDLGIAEVFDEDKSPEEFLEMIKKMINNLDSYKSNNPSLIDGDAAEKVIKVIKETAKQ